MVSAWGVCEVKSNGKAIDVLCRLVCAKSTRVCPLESVNACRFLDSGRGLSFPCSSKTALQRYGMSREIDLNVMMQNAVMHLVMQVLADRQTVKIITVD